MSPFRRKALHPNHIVIGAFILVVLAGAILLSLPVSGARGPLALIDALFTSASAVCVTGLVVVDTGRDLSRFGQIVTIILIQIGGLGITTFSTFFIYLTGGRMSLRGRGVVETTMTQFPVQNIGQLLLKILVVTLVIEAIGTVLLYPLLTPHGGGEGHFAVFTAVYHSVSAFCNAGFSLYSTNLAAYRNSAGVSLVICALVILGGLGFVVISELWDRFLRRRSQGRRLSLHTRLVLTVTAALLVAGTAMVFLLEGGNTLAGMLPGHKLLASFFQATTPRTAGFNTIPIGACGSATLLFMMILMFIGASPGSCGGGIKTTSFAVLLGLAVSRLKGTEDVNIFSRRVPDEIVSRAISVAFFGGVVLLAVVMLLCVTETALQRSYSGDNFLALVFEAASAFGTVGLSTGITPSLSVVGKLLIIVLMMVGRLGPLTIAIALAARELRPRFRYASETVMIG